MNKALTIQQAITLISTMEQIINHLHFDRTSGLMVVDGGSQQLQMSREEYRHLIAAVRSIKKLQVQ